MKSDSEYSYVCLLDVLGYRNSLAKDRRNGNMQFKDQLIRSLSTLSRVNETIFGYQAISDTIILTCHDINHFKEYLKLVKRLYIGFLSQKLLVRGGISYNQHFKSSTVTYSFALSSAYELEHEKAIYPRIVIDNNIIGMLSDNGTIDSWDNLVILENGTHYLNILSSDNIHKVYGLVKEIYMEAKDSLLYEESIYLKYKWLHDRIIESDLNKDLDPFIDPPVYI
jgi:hypothetical protein